MIPIIIIIYSNILRDLFIYSVLNRGNILYKITELSVAYKYSYIHFDFPFLPKNSIAVSRAALFSNFKSRIKYIDYTVV